MVKSVIIREVMPNDALRLVELSRQLGYSISVSEMQANIEMCLNDSQYKIFITEIKQEVCGFIGLITARWLHRNGSWAKVLSLVVNEQQRGLKIGSQLLTFAENYVKAQGCDKIELVSGLHRRQSGAHQFYLNHGYESDLTQYFVKKLSKE
jgi:GNAT superfamily N-acetyltransferase